MMDGWHGWVMVMVMVMIKQDLPFYPLLVPTFFVFLFVGLYIHITDIPIFLFWWFSLMEKVNLIPGFYTSPVCTSAAMLSLLVMK